MRGVLAVLFLASAFSVKGWELPTPAELAAVQGEYPFAAALEAGLPLPPTRDEARRAGVLPYEQARLALKKVMLLRTSRAKAERRRITPENNRLMAVLAQQAGAPAVFCRYLALLADDSLSRRQQYVVNQLLQHFLQQVYGIDELQMRLLSEAVDLPADEHAHFLLQLPLQGMFDLVPAKSLAVEENLADLHFMTTLLREAGAGLLKVRDAATADAAAQELQQLLPLWNTTWQTRSMLQEGTLPQLPAISLSLQQLDASTSRLMTTLRLLAEARWYGSKRLQSIAGQLL